MSLTLRNATATPFYQQRYSRDVNSTIQRLAAGVTVRPQDDPAAFASYQRALEFENRTKTASINAERSQAYGSAALEQLNRVDVALEELRALYVQDAGDADTQKRIDELVDQVSRAQQTEFKGRSLFTTSIDEVEAPTVPTDYAGPQGQSLRLDIEQTDRDQTTRVEFGRSLDDAVVIANLRTTNDTDPAHVRVTSVGRNGAQVKVEEFDYQDGVHGNETVDLLALEAGVYTLESGQRIEVGRVSVDNDWQRIEFSQSFDATPVVLTTVQSANDSTAVVVRQGYANNEKVLFKLQEQESTVNSDRVEEVVGYIAIEAGFGELDELSFFASETPRGVYDRKSQISFGETFDDPSLFAAISTTNGRDTSGLRVDEVRGDQATIYVEEEASRDAEINHTYEQVAYFALDGVGRIGPETTPLPQTPDDRLTFTTTPELALNETGFSASLAAADRLGDLKSGQSLAYAGDRAEALQVIDEIASQVDGSIEQTKTFVRVTVGSVEKVNQASLAAATAVRQQLEDRASLEVAEDARRLMLRSAGQTLVNSARQAQAETLLTLVESTSGQSLSRPTGYATLQTVQNAQQSQLSDALSAFTQAAALGSASSLATTGSTTSTTLASPTLADDADDADDALITATARLDLLG